MAGRKQRWLAGFLALTMVNGLAACGTPAPVPTPEVVATPSPTPTAQPVEFALACYPTSGFHPILGTSRTNLFLAGLLYDGLYELDPNFEPQSALAIAHTVSENGLVWTFTLRQGVTCSDGSVLTPADVVYSLNLAKSSTLYGARLAQVTSVRAKEGAVELTLSAPNGALPALLDIPVVKPGNDTRPVGTGLYALEGEGSSILLRRRSNSWHGEAPGLETIPLRVVEQSDDLIYSFDTQEVSMVGTDFTGADSLGFSGSFETVDFSTSTMLYVGYNTTKGVCQEAKVRQALGRGMDRTTVCTALLSRHAVEATLPAHPTASVYDTELAERMIYSPQAMGELLVEAGWSKADGKYTRRGKQLALTLLVNQDNGYKLDVADELGRELTAAGIAVTVKKLPWADYLSALEKGAFDLYLGEVKLTADFDPSPLLGNGALNYGRFVHADTAALLAAFRTAKGEARPSAAKALYEHLEEQAPFMVLCFKNGSVLSQWGQVTGMTPTQQNLFHGFASWEIAQ